MTDKRVSGTGQIDVSHTHKKSVKHKGKAKKKQNMMTIITAYMRVRVCVYGKNAYLTMIFVFEDEWQWKSVWEDENTQKKRNFTFFLFLLFL